MQSQQLEQFQDDEVDFKELGVLEGHNGWPTSIISGFSQKEGEDSNVLISGSRDKTIMIWKLFGEQREDGKYGVPQKSLTGHNNFVSDLALSQDNQFLISSSWDKTLRMWDLNTGKSNKQFIGHTKEIFSVAFSPDNRQIVSTGADKEIKLWNILGDCKFTSDQNNHTEWTFQPYFTTVGWDGRLKVWNTNFQIRYSLKPHAGSVNTVSISPNGKFLVTGGKDQWLYIWDIADMEEPIRKIETGAVIHQIAFNPKLQWVGAATETGIKVWDLIGDNMKPIADLKVQALKKEEKKGKPTYLQCTSICWNSSGKKLFGGFTDNKIHVYHVAASNDAEPVTK